MDSFTDHFAPEVALAAARVLEAAGYRVQVPGADTCCGLTWITTGQLDAARKILGRTVATLAPAGRRRASRSSGSSPPAPPCCAATRSSWSAGRPPSGVAAGTRTLAELLAETPGWEPPSLAGVEVVAQPHCHHASVLGWSADAALLPGPAPGSPGSAAAAGWPATGASSAATTTCR